LLDQQKQQQQLLQQQQSKEAPPLPQTKPEEVSKITEEKRKSYSLSLAVN